MVLEVSIVDKNGMGSHWKGLIGESQDIILEQSNAFMTSIFPLFQKISLIFYQVAVKTKSDCNPSYMSQILH